MPRNNGIYSPPSGTQATPLTAISSAAHNSFVDDLTNDLNNARPVIAGGTGATTAAGALANLAGGANGLHAIGDKATPADADELALVDSADSWSLKKLTWANIKTALSSVFLPLTGGNISGNVTADGDVYRFLRAYTYSNSGFPSFYLARARGSKSSPTAVQNGDILGQLSTSGHTGTALSSAGSFAFYATSNYGTEVKSRAALNIYNGSVFTAQEWLTNGDSNLAGRLKLTGTPTDPQHAATKTYVDGLALGIGQTWQNVTASRAVGVTYQNTTGRPIQVAVATRGGGDDYFQCSLDGTTWVDLTLVGYGNTTYSTYAVVPNNVYYRANTAAALHKWAELR